MPLILGTNSIKDTGYNVDNSLRFNKGSSDYLNKTFGTSTSEGTWTYSVWIKISDPAFIDNHVFFSGGGASDNRTQLYFGETTGTLNIYRSISGSTVNLESDASFRDPSAWYNLCVQNNAGTVAAYINGVAVTLDGSSLGTNVINKSDTVHKIGRGATGTYTSSYMSEIVFIDGTVVAPTSFGEFDEDSGIWKPIDVSGLTFGTNGFYLDFEDSSNLGNDANGGTDLTEVNLAATDQSTDTCTNNFATLNPLHSIGAASELSQGNLEYDPSGHHRIISTIAPSSGKWYAEVKGIDNPDKFNAGVAHYPMPANGSASSFAFGQGVNADVGRFANDFGVKANGQYGNDNSYANYMASLESENNNIVGIYLDLDNYKIYFSKNGTLVSSTGKDLTNNGEPYGFISVGEAATFQWNFGNPSFALANTAITDDNGFGAFEYSPNITGDSEAKSFFALCTKNLAEYG